MPSKVRITTDLLGHGRIIIDDHDMSKAVYGFRVVSEAGERLQIVLDLSVTEIDVTTLGQADQEMFVNLSDDVVTALLALGWTPPADDRRTYRVARPAWNLSDEDAEVIDNASPDAND